MDELHTLIHPCPEFSGETVRDYFVEVLCRFTGELKNGHKKVVALTMAYLREGEKKPLIGLSSPVASI